MTKKYKAVTIPARTVERVDSTICDLCGKETGRYGWGDSEYSVEEVHVKYESGKSYPDDFFSETTEVDLCPQCFKERLIPWIESQGAKPRKRDTDD